MKALRYIAWISAAVAVLLILLACISLLMGKVILGSHLVNYFNAANSFLLIAIALFIVTKQCNCSTDTKTEVK